MCMLFSVAWADTVITFIPGETVGTQETVSTADQMSRDGITISTTYGAFKAAQYRFGMNAVTTIKSEIGNITKIEFTGASGTNPISGFGDNEGMSYEGNDGTWTGDAEEVVITTRVKQARASKIVVYVGGNGLASPRISPAGGTYYDPIQVNITCATAGAKIYYTTNGSNPTTSSQQFSAPFTVSNNMTVKAISALNGEVSPVVTAEYVFSSERVGLGALAGIADNTDVVLGYDATVLHQAGSTLYIMDQTGYGLIYGNVGQTYKLGNVISSGYGGQKVTYNGEPEVKNPVGFTASSGNVTVNPQKITASQVNHANWAHYVVIENAVINMTDDNNGTLTDASGSCPVYNRTFGATLPTDGQPHKVIGIVASYQPGGEGEVTYQILPIMVEGAGGGGDTEVGIGELPNVADNTNVTLVHDATVIWQGGNNNAYLYVKDETGYGLIYGNTGQTYYIGDIIPAGYTGKKTTYKGEPELASPAGLQPATTYVHVTPETKTTQDVNHDNWAHYVLIKNATLSEDKKTLTDANGSCDFYNGTFNIELPADGQPHNWYGIVGVFNNYQFLPLSWDQEPQRPEPALPVDVETINELYSNVAEGGQQGHFTTQLTAIYHHAPYLYVQDTEGTQTLVYGTVTDEFSNGNLINDAIVTWTTYQAAPQMLPVENFVIAGNGAKIMPDEPLPIEEISQDMVHRYLSFEDFSIVEDGGKYYIEDETGRLQIFDKFGLFPDGFDMGATYAEGFLTIYRGELELYPIEVGDGGMDCGTKGDVNQDKEINIADINALIDIILSSGGDQCARWRADVNGDLEVNIADVNALISLILSGH